MSDKAIPNSWIQAKLGSLGLIGSSKRVHQKDWRPQGIPFYRAREIAKLSQYGVVENELFISQELFEAFSKEGLSPSPGDLMITGVGTIGMPYVVKEKDKFYFKDASVLIFKNKYGLDSEYLYYYFTSEGCRQEISAGSKGTTVDTLTISRALEIPVPLPPLNEQKRIVAKIEELFSELDAGEESLRKARRQLGTYRQSLLKQAFEGKLTAPWREQNPHLLESPEDFLEVLEAGSKHSRIRANQIHVIPSWTYRTLGELTEFITSGSRGWAEYYSDSGSLFIRAQNLNRDYLSLEDIAFVSPPQSAEGRRTQVKYGDLLITITGANTTKAGWVNTILEDAYVSQHVALCRPVSDKLSEFIYRFVISSAGGRKKLEKDAYGAGKPGLNLDNVRSLVVPIPSLPEQQEIVRLLDEQFTVIEQNEREIDTALKRSEALRQSILKKAFSGQLVPQDPADEPAAALLERIRQKRPTQHTKTRK